MKTKIPLSLSLLSCIILQTPPVFAAFAAKSAEPYLGAIVVDADSGQILIEDHSDIQGYPASMLKLMDLLIILEKIKAGSMKLDEKITITAEAAQIGGSQVYLKENETFTVDELLYALMVQSANDAATALAIQAAGSREGFVALMNQRARELGLKSTTFQSIHGLPPAKDQTADISTARDLARLARELLKYPDALRYTACRERGFRGDKFIMRNHNHLLAAFPGCDGLKTGYFKKAGYSITATAKRGNTRLIAVVLGSKSKKERDRKAAELLSKGFALTAQQPALIPTPAPVAQAPEPVEEKKAPSRTRLIWVIISGLALLGIAAGCYVFFFHLPKKRDLQKDLLQRH